MSLTERDYITLCKKQIEEKLRFENGNGSLKQRDLEYLADVIEEKAGIRLSLSTLKRLWKNEYEQTPHPSTLQALVSLLDCKDWQEFKLKQQPAVSPTPKTAVSKKRFSKWLLIPVAAGLVLLFWAITFNTHAPLKTRAVVKGPVLFTANKTVSQGVPNTVIFNYDVKNIKADSFCIQQSWNELEKVRIDPNGHYLSLMYYYPGFHRAKLLANDSIIVRKRIHITTDGWEPLVRYDKMDKIPVYLGKKDMVANGMLHITKENLLANKVNTEKPFMQSYFNVRDFDSTSSDNFAIDTRLKVDSISNIACASVEFGIICEEHIFYVLLQPKGCARDIAVKMGEVYRDGGNNDLSALGCNTYQWQRLQIKVINKQATVYLNEQPVYTTAFKLEFGKIMGITYHFSGTGSVDYFRLGKNDTTWVYADEFN
jgi:hypothetical protein